MRAAALCLLLLVTACARGPVTSAATPELAYRSFLTALEKRQLSRAWGYLSRATQDRARERSKRLVEASKGLVRDEPEALLFQGSRPPRLATLKISPVREDASTAVLSVEDGGEAFEVTLVNESGKWFIDFSERL